MDAGGQILEFPFITGREQLVEFLEQCPQGVPCCVDTEADSLFSYREKVCLLQFCCDGRIALIDPLVVEDVSPLLDFLDQASEIWMHGADYDMSILKRTYGRVPDRIYDTQIAARLAGCRVFGLAHLTNEMFGVSLSKQSQKKNWGERPLSPVMLEYAANDVRYMLPMAEIFKTKLHKLGRWDWFLQSCDAARETVFARPDKSRDEMWRIPGWGKLSGRAMAYLRALWEWRDEVACAKDRPAFKVMNNEQLLSYSNELAAGRHAELPPRFRSGIKSRFIAAIETASALPESELPKKPSRKQYKRSEDWEVIYNRLRNNRDEGAKRLDLEPAFISSKASMERYAFASEGERTQEFRNELFLPWQQEIVFPEDR